MRKNRKPTVEATKPDPRFPDYTKVTGHAYDEDVEVKRTQVSK